MAVGGPMRVSVIMSWRLLSQQNSSSQTSPKPRGGSLGDRIELEKSRLRVILTEIYASSCLFL